MIAKADLKSLMAKVDLLLWKEWAPIGCDLPRDEYTSYANVACGKAINGESETQILDYLYWAESENMGMGIARVKADERNRPIVAKVFELVRAAKAKQS